MDSALVTTVLRHGRALQTLHLISIMMLTLTFRDIDPGAVTARSETAHCWHYRLGGPQILFVLPVVTIWNATCLICVCISPNTRHGWPGDGARRQHKLPCDSGPTLMVLDSGRVIYLTWPDLT